MKKRNVLVYLLTGCVLTASMSVGTTTAVHAEAATTSAAAVEPGTNMYAAGELTLNTPVSGTIEGSDDYAWYSFTTGAAGTEYQISCLNNTPGSNLLYFNIFDEMGTELYSDKAASNGLPCTITASDLQADTTYYIRLGISDMGTRDYVLTVKDPTAPAPEIISTGEELVAGDSMYNAGSIPLGKKASGAIEGSDDYAWYSFTTEAEAGAEYQISCVNGTPGSNLLYFDIFDEMGAVLHSGEADSNGLPSTIITGDLQPDTTYYIRLSISDMGTRDYIVLIKTTKEDSKKAAAADGKAAADAEASTTKAE